MMAMVSSSGYTGLSVMPARMYSPTASISYWKPSPGKSKRCVSGFLTAPMHRDLGRMPEAGNGDIALAAHDARFVRRVEANGGGDARHFIIAVFEDGDRQFVNAGRAQGHLRDDLAGLLAKDHRRQLHRVGADIEQGAAGQIRAEGPRIGIHAGRAVAEVGLQQHDIADGARGQQLTHFAIAGKKRVQKASIRKSFFSRAQATMSRASAALTAKGFSQKYRLARVQAQQRMRLVIIVRRADVDDIDIRIVDQRFVAAVALRRAELRAEGVRLCLRARGDGVDFGYWARGGSNCRSGARCCPAR